jgi:hypothetical protein
MKRAFNAAIERALRRRRVDRLAWRLREKNWPPVGAARIGKKGAGTC